MFERYTEQARKAVILAQAQVKELGHNYIGTEHFLLGLILQGDRTAEVLGGLGVTRETVLPLIDEVVGQRATALNNGNVPFSPTAKLVHELAIREALQRGHIHVGTEHLAAGLIRVGERHPSAVALTILTQLVDTNALIKALFVPDEAELQTAAAPSSAYVHIDPSIIGDGATEAVVRAAQGYVIEHITVVVRAQDGSTATRQVGWP